MLNQPAEVRHASVRNRLLDSLSGEDRDLIADGLRAVRVTAGETLFAPGEDVETVLFPGAGTIVSLVLNLEDGIVAETAMIGWEGAAGGVISHGHKPAYTYGTVQVPGVAFRLSAELFDEVNQESPVIRDLFARYSDCLLAQVLQTVACNAAHDFEERLARWLLGVQDRVGRPELHLTQEFVAQMLGVQRSYATKIIGRLERSGAIERGRGVILIRDRGILMRRSCECYGCLRRHFERVLPGVYPGSSS